MSAGRRDYFVRHVHEGVPFGLLGAGVGGGARRRVVLSAVREGREGGGEESAERGRVDKDYCGAGGHPASGVLSCV